MTVSMSLTILDDVGREFGDENWYELGCREWHRRRPGELI